MGWGVLDRYIHQITEGMIGDRGKDNQQDTEKGNMRYPVRHGACVLTASQVCPI
jgi:hypothetical protein